MRKTVTYLNRLRHNVDDTRDELGHVAMEVEELFTDLAQHNEDVFRKMTDDEIQAMYKEADRKIQDLRSALKFHKNAVLTYKDFF